MTEVGFVLLHGAGLGGWIWDAVLPLLDAPAIAVDLRGPGDGPRSDATLARCVERVLHEVEGWGRVVVVGHSVSGGVALAVASRLGERAAGIALVGAVVPPTGRAYVDTLPWPQRWLIRLLYAAAPGGLRPPARVLRHALCSDLDEATATRVVERVEVALPRLFLDPVRWALPPSVARRYLLLTEDTSDLSPRLQATFAEALQAEIVPLSTGHLPMISCPDAVAAALRDLAA